VPNVGETLERGRLTSCLYDDSEHDQPDPMHAASSTAA
jgi:hypothetical protein